MSFMCQRGAARVTADRDSIGGVGFAGEGRPYSATHAGVMAARWQCKVACNVHATVHAKRSASSGREKGKEKGKRKEP